MFAAKTKKKYTYCDKNNLKAVAFSYVNLFLNRLRVYHVINKKNFHLKFQQLEVQLVHTRKHTGNFINIPDKTTGLSAPLGSRIYTFPLIYC